MAVKVELFTSSFCPVCERARSVVAQAITDLGPECFDVRMLDVVEEIDHAVALGVLSAPTIVVDGEPEYMTRPSVHQVKTILRKHVGRVRS